MARIKLALNNWMAGSGKDLIADYLVNEWGFKKYALADGIYEIAHTYFGVPIGERPPRKMMHHIGESLRQYDKMVWINETLKRIDNDGFERVVITDVRKLLEHAYLKETGWTNVMIYCDPKIAIQRIKKRDGVVDEDLIMNSSLENQLRPLKDSMMVIDNSGDFKNTLKEVDALLNLLHSSSRG